MAWLVKTQVTGLTIESLYSNTKILVDHALLPGYYLMLFYIPMDFLFNHSFNKSFLGIVLEHPNG
jgi:uncharacterized membrane protein